MQYFSLWIARLKETVTTCFLFWFVTSVLLTGYGGLQAIADNGKE